MCAPYLLGGGGGSGGEGIVNLLYSVFYTKLVGIIRSRLGRRAVATCSARRLYGDLSNPFLRILLLSCLGDFLFAL